MRVTRDRAHPVWVTVTLSSEHLIKIHGSLLVLTGLTFYLKTSMTVFLILVTVYPVGNTVLVLLVCHHLVLPNLGIKIDAM